MGARGEHACWVKRGHCGHLEIIGNHTTKLMGKEEGKEKGMPLPNNVRFSGLIFGSVV